MLSFARYAGGARELTIAANTVISAGNARCWSVTASGAGLEIQLEAATAWTYRVGFPVFVIYNAGGVNTFDIRASDGSMVQATLALGGFVQIGLISLSSGGTWIAKVT